MSHVCRLLNAPLPVTLGPLVSSSNISGNGTAAPPAAEADLLHGADAPWNLLLQQMPAGSNPASGQVTLEQLLKRKHTADLQDAAGNTALHMVVACLVSKVHFPDPKLTAAEPEADGESALCHCLAQQTVDVARWREWHHAVHLHVQILPHMRQKHRQHASTTSLNASNSTSSTSTAW